MNKNKIEVWKSHPYIVGVEASTFGNVRTLNKMVSNGRGTYPVKGRVLKQSENGHGYLHVGIQIDGKGTKKLIHRLVAQTFIPNPDNLPQVNHRDCNRKNNNVDNLEWCTASYNSKYREKFGISAKNNAPKSSVCAINLTTLEISRFRSHGEASRELGVFHSNITAVIKGRYKQTGGYWFVNDDDKADDAISRKLQEIKKI